MDVIIGLIIFGAFIFTFVVGYIILFCGIKKIVASNKVDPTN